MDTYQGDSFYCVQHTVYITSLLRYGLHTYVEIMFTWYYIVLFIFFYLSGRPSPKVTWWRGGSLIDETFQVISSDGAIQNTMTVQRLSRADLHAVYTCQASNTIQVEMYCK